MPAGKVVDRKGHPLPDQAQGQDEASYRQAGTRMVE